MKFYWYKSWVDGWVDNFDLYCGEEFLYVKFGKGVVFVCIKLWNYVIGNIVECIFRVGE